MPFSDSFLDKLWVNPGVIGMPANDGETSVWYMIFEEINGELVYKHEKLRYNFEVANQLMIKNNLPKEYADTLLTGIWDNTEILPQFETELQGCALQF